VVTLHVVQSVVTFDVAEVELCNIVTLSVSSRGLLKGLCSHCRSATIGHDIFVNN